MNIAALKEKVMHSLDIWLYKRIDDMAKGNSTLLIPAVYMKRGCHNIINKHKEDICNSIDKAALFIADEDGNINADTLFTDAMALFKEIEETDFDIGLMRGTIGRGELSVVLPDNILLNIIFGNKRTVTFNENDFIELKNLLTAEA